MPTLRKRSSGILLHVTSLPGPYGCGDLGPRAHEFLDFLAETGQTWWQMLPVVPPGAGHSPYSALSAFAGNTLLISLERLADEGLLQRSRLAPPAGLGGAVADFAAAERLKQERLHEAFEAFETSAPGEVRSQFDAWAHDEAWWLEDYALFMALRHERLNVSWWEWEHPVRLREHAALEEARRRLAKRLRFERFAQWQFDKDWKCLRSAAAARGLGLIGDIPIFVARDSAEVWAHPELFLLDGEGWPIVVAGVPPDYFSKDGQLWGNPLYRWDVMRSRGYDWWIARLRAAFARFDAVRIDHFIGFHNYWEIPGHAKTARDGRWMPGPGAEFFERVFAALGGVELIAEDLGIVTDEVRALRDRFDLPGMVVLQFAFGLDPESRNYQPHRFRRRCIVYPGTHDNDTIVGWWKDQGSASSTRTPEQIEKERAFVMTYIGSNGRQIHWDMIRTALSSPADVAIIPAQDLLGLGSEARMNMPGTAQGNWRWRLTRPLPRGVGRRLKTLTDAFERAR